MNTVARRKLEPDVRYLQQNARFAIRDIYDAIIELVTNSDDAYAKTGVSGQIEIEIERRRKGNTSLLRVRDFGPGLSSHDMDVKLSHLGNRHDSGLADGADVRGTNSRGAKDVAALGMVTFESIVADGRYAYCQITPRFEFVGPIDCQADTHARRKVNIPQGTGTLVSIELDPSVLIPQHDTLAKNLSLLVPLRGILSDHDRQIVLRDLRQSREDQVRYHAPEGTERVSESIAIPGYPEARAKLVIKRAKKPLDNKGKFRQGGILVKSRRAIHQATFFDPQLDHDSHAAYFFGTLRCEYIDDLWNDFDARQEKDEPLDPKNPCPIIDPNRQGGLRPEHPFYKALQREALKRLRPLVEEEREREAARRAQVENDQTRRQLDELEKLATKFMEDHQEDEDSRDNPTDQEGGRKLLDYTLNPPFAQIVVNQRQRFWLNANQEKYPELAVGSTAQLECESEAIGCVRPVCLFEQHPTRQGALRCLWEIIGKQPSKATGIIVRAGAIAADAAIEVLASERDKYADLAMFQFERSRYFAKPGIRKPVRVIAPHPGIICSPTVVQIACDNDLVKIEGDRVAHPRTNLGIAECRFHVTLPEPDMKVRLHAEIPGHRAETEVIVSKSKGTAIKINIEDGDFGNQRAIWQKDGSTLDIAARHPSVRRYLGPQSQGFPGQDKPQFKVLLAEIVAFAVSERILSRNIMFNPDEYRGDDFDAYMARRDELVTKFLPQAHESQVPNPR